MRAGKYADAVKAYRPAVQALPTDGGARVKFADALVASGDWGQAALEALQAADLLRQDVEVQVRAAALLATQQRFVDALDLASAVLTPQPDHVGALVVSANAR